MSILRNLRYAVLPPDDEFIVDEEEYEVKVVDDFELLKYKPDVTPDVEGDESLHHQAVRLEAGEYIG